MTEIKAGGPYFDNQKASDRKGHFHPDVVRVMDIKIHGECFRITHCVECGYSLRKIQLNEYSTTRNSPETIKEYREWYRAAAKAGSLHQSMKV